MYCAAPMQLGKISFNEGRLRRVNLHSHLADRLLLLRNSASLSRPWRLFLCSKPEFHADCRMSMAHRDAWEGGHMSLGPFRLALISGLLLWAPASLAERSSAPTHAAPGRSGAGQAARDLAYAHPSRWSA